MLTLKDEVVKFRNSLSHGIYGSILKPIFFKSDPETIHESMVSFGSQLGRHAVSRVGTKILFGYSDKKLEQKILGMTFKNPIGLAAGFDKNAELTDIIPDVGFGFEEVGSITGRKCEGNPLPRLWRLPESRGLVVYYGLKNDGAVRIANRLKRKNFKGILGTSIAMTNCSDNLELSNAVKDYAEAFEALADVGDYFTLNISCPNTEGGQPFVAPYKLDYLLDIIDEIPTEKPIFIKLSPDMSFREADEVLVIAKKHRVAGIITTNLTKKETTAESLMKTYRPSEEFPANPFKNQPTSFFHIFTKEKASVSFSSARAAYFPPPTLTKKSGSVLPWCR